MNVRDDSTATIPPPLPSAEPPLLRRVVSLGLPVLGEQLLLYLVGFSDTLLTGRYLDVSDLAAVTVGSYLMWFLGSLLIVASAGGTALVSRRVGAGNPAAASRIAQQAVVLGMAVGLLIVLAGFPAMPRIATGLGLEGRAADQAVVYFRTILLAMPLQAALSVGNACLRGAGDTRTGLAVMVLVNAINVVLSWLLVVGFGPVPALGLAGVAAGTAIGEGTGGLVMLGLLLRGRSGLRLQPSGFRFVADDLRPLLSVSIPAAVESGANAGFQLVFLRLINSLGDVATAAHGVAIRCESIAFLTVMAFAVPASTLVGQSLGAGRPDRASHAGRVAWGLGVLALGLLGLILIVFAGPMFGLFLGRARPEVAAAGVPAVRLIGFAMPAFATLSVLSAALRGAGDTAVPMRIVFAGYLLVRLPLTWWLIRPVDQGGMGWGLLGAWVAMTADIHVRAALIARRFLSNGWTRIRL
jgi:putative MATE family efflux protein